MFEQGKADDCLGSSQGNRSLFFVNQSKRIRVCDKIGIRASEIHFHTKHFPVALQSAIRNAKGREKIGFKEGMVNESREHPKSSCIREQTESGGGRLDIFRDLEQVFRVEVVLTKSVSVVGGVAVVRYVVESERVDESDSTFRFHRAVGRVFVEVAGDIEVLVRDAEGQKGALFVREVLGEQVGGTVQSMNHAE